MPESLSEKGLFLSCAVLDSGRFLPDALSDDLPLLCESLLPFLKKSLRPPASAGGDARKASSAHATKSASAEARPGRLVEARIVVIVLILRPYPTRIEGTRQRPAHPMPIHADV